MPNIPVDIIRWKLDEIKKHDEREENVVYVTDLVMCPLKRYFELKFPELRFNKALNGRLLFGDIIHVGVEAILREIYGERVVTERDRDLTREKHVEVDGRIYKVRGRVDAILDETMGIEIKSNLSNDQPLPLPWHAMQARIYNWLYGFQKTMLLYVTPYGMFQYEIEDRISESEIVRLIKQEKAPRYHWECKYCEYASICPIVRKVQEKNVG